MTKKGFFEGLGISLLLGVTFSFYNSILASVISVAIGAFIAESKKEGGAIGFLASPIILLAPASLPITIIYSAGKIDLLFLLIMIVGSAFNMYFTISWIIAIVLGVIIGHYSMKRKTAYESSVGESEMGTIQSHKFSHKIDQ